VDGKNVGGRNVETVYPWMYMKGDRIPIPVHEREEGY